MRAREREFARVARAVNWPDHRFPNYHAMKAVSSVAGVLAYPARTAGQLQDIETQSTDW
jgi:hypothetical protein